MEIQLSQETTKRSVMVTAVLVFLSAPLCSLSHLFCLPVPVFAALKSSIKTKVLIQSMVLLHLGPNAELVTWHNQNFPEHVSLLYVSLREFMFAFVAWWLHCSVMTLHSVTDQKEKEVQILSFFKLKVCLLCAANQRGSSCSTTLQLLLPAWREPTFHILSS